MNTTWLAHIQKTTSACGQIDTKDVFGKSLVIEWKSTDILSPDLAPFKATVSDLASEERGLIQGQFLRIHLDAASSELFLKPCAPLLEEGLKSVNWEIIHDKIQATIKQFYLTDLSKFPQEVIKPLMDDIYFFATIKNKEDDHLCGFIMFSVTPALPFGTIKVINLLVHSKECHRGLEKALINSITQLIPETTKIALFVRPTNESAIQTYHSLGFFEDPFPFQDPKHKINANYSMPLAWQK